MAQIENIDAAEQRDESKNASAEFPAGEAAPYLKRLVDDVRQDLGDRAEWKTQVLKNRQNRFKKRATAKPAYPGAPNVVDPIIDDLIREVRDQEISMLFNTATLASFIPTSIEAVQTADTAEKLFDDHLRHFGYTRARLEVIFDHKRCDGMGVAKLVGEKTKAGDELPHFIPLDPLDVVVPVNTRSLSEADRVCHIINYTKAEFDAAVRSNKWDESAAKSLKAAIAEKSGTGSGGVNATDGRGDETGGGRAGWKDEKLSDSHGTITVWEIYYTRETKNGEGIGRRRFMAVLSPDFPEFPLSEKPWEYAPIVLGATQVVDPVTGQPQIDPATGEPMVAATCEPVPVRQWPFFQFRNEGRSLDYHDTRGDPELLEMDQKEASGFRTARLIAADFTGKPFIKGEKRVEMFKFRAGDWLGDNAVVFSVPPTENLIYQGDYARSNSVRRVGGASGAVSGADPSRDRKTATEVSVTQQQASGTAANNVDRSAEPLGELFAAIWHDLAYAARLMRKSPPLMVRAAATGPEESGHEEMMKVFSHRYLVVCGLSGRTANTVMQLQQLNTVAAFAEKFPQVMQFTKGYELANLIWASINPAWARLVMIDPKRAGQAGGAPIEQKVDQLMLMMQELGQIVGRQNKYLEVIAKEDQNANGIPDSLEKGGGK